MAATNRSLFSWDDVENLPDLKRLSLVLDYIPDEKIVQAMERNRGNGRDDFPVRPMWNAVIAGIVFQHESIESLIRELSRNPKLLTICGFDPIPVQRKPTARIVKKQVLLPERCQDFCADRGLDSGKIKAILWDGHKIRPMIPCRELWREEKKNDPQYDSSKPVIRSLFPDQVDTIVYTEKGTVHCVCPKTGIQRDLAFQVSYIARGIIGPVWEYKKAGQRKCLPP